MTSHTVVRAKRLLQTHELVVFYLLACSVTWTAIGIWTAFGRSPVSRLAELIVVFGPVIAAILTVKLTGRSIRKWIRSLGPVPGSARWYLAAVAIMGVFAGISALVYGLLGGEFVSTGIPLVVFLVILLGTLTINGGIEEFGWRGYLLPRLQQRWSPIIASLIVGTAWAFWHLPMYVVPGALYYGQPFWLFGSLVVLMSFWYTWLYNVSDGSILPVVFLHGLHNAATVLYPFAPESIIVAIVPAIVAYVTVTLGLVVLTKGKLAGSKGPVHLGNASSASAEVNATPL